MTTEEKTPAPAQTSTAPPAGEPPAAPVKAEGDPVKLEALIGEVRAAKEAHSREAAQAGSLKEKVAAMEAEIARHKAARDQAAVDLVSHLKDIGMDDKEIIAALEGGMYHFMPDKATDSVRIRQLDAQRKRDLRRLEKERVERETAAKNEQEAASIAAYQRGLQDLATSGDSKKSFPKSHKFYDTPEEYADALFVKALKLSASGRDVRNHAVVAQELENELKGRVTRATQEEQTPQAGNGESTPKAAAPQKAETSTPPPSKSKLDPAALKGKRPHVAQSMVINDVLERWESIMPKKK